MSFGGGEGLEAKARGGEKKRDQREAIWRKGKQGKKNKKMKIARLFLFPSAPLIEVGLFHPAKKKEKVKSLFFPPPFLFTLKALFPFFLSVQYVGRRVLRVRERCFIASGSLCVSGGTGERGKCFHTKERGRGPVFSSLTGACSSTMERHTAICRRFQLGNKRKRERKLRKGKREFV